jgi:hypothetical protein
MKSYLRGLALAAALALIALPALAYVEFLDANGNRVPGMVTMGLNGAGQATVGSPGTRTLVALDIATVTTGGTAVVALNAGHKTAGGWLQNPSTATVALCINELGTASGTSSAGSTTCIVPGQTYTLTATPGGVSVISADSAHAFSGYGYN